MLTCLGYFGIPFSPGTEAMFADLGHFTASSVRVSSSLPSEIVIFCCHQSILLILLLESQNGG